MKDLLAAIETAKKTKNIEQYHFEDKRIFYNQKWHEGKVLNLHFIDTNYPTKFPFGEQERQLLIEISRLGQMNYEVVNICKYGDHYSINIIPRRVGLDVEANLTMNKIDTGIPIQCTECKGTRYYQPLIGPREPCRTCS